MHDIHVESFKSFRVSELDDFSEVTHQAGKCAVVPGSCNVILCGRAFLLAVFRRDRGADARIQLAGVAEGANDCGETCEVGTPTP